MELKITIVIVILIECTVTSYCVCGSHQDSILQHIYIF